MVIYIYIYIYIYIEKLFSYIIVEEDPIWKFREQPVKNIIWQLHTIVCGTHVSPSNDVQKSNYFSKLKW